jgi:hypothetical protein
MLLEVYFCLDQKFLPLSGAIPLSGFAQSEEEIR